jgi:hypothetical protein
MAASVPQIRNTLFTNPGCDTDDSRHYAQKNCANAEFSCRGLQESNQGRLGTAAFCKRLIRSCVFSISATRPE